MHEPLKRIQYQFTHAMFWWDVSPQMQASILWSQAQVKIEEWTFDS